VFQAHSDTKPAAAAGWTVDPLGGEVRDGRLYGLGACDTKGGLAAQLVAARLLAERDNWSGELVLQAVADEEDGSQLGAGHLLEQGLLAADGAIVAEPTGCVPSLAQLGNAWAEITITGQAAHAGTPERGTDAFQAALLYIAEIEALLATIEPDPAFPGHPRLNVGHLSVPGHPGTVPGQCSLRCDIRVLPGHDRDDVLALYGRAAERVRERITAQVALTPYQGGGGRSHRVDAGSPLAAAFRTTREQSGRAPSWQPFAGGTDARYFAAAGTAAVVYGPGDLAQAHAPDEFVPVDELELAVEDLCNTAHHFLEATITP